MSTSLAITLNRSQVLAEYKKVVDGPCDAWVLYSYVPQTKDELEVVCTGKDGLEEIAEEFHPNKIMYALIKVEDPKTTLPKVACINWQGEAVTGLMRGRAAKHLADFERMFRGINITIHARNEDDVDPELILAEITRASATSYDFKNRPQSMSDNPEPIAPVGTNYTPIKPQNAIAPAEVRNQFWSKQQEEDKVRREQEQKAREAREKKAAEDLKKKEAESQKRRNQEVKQRALQIAAVDKPQDIHVKMTSPNRTGSVSSGGNPHSRSNSVSSSGRPASLHNSPAYNTFMQKQVNSSVPMPNGGVGSKVGQGSLNVIGNSTVSSASTTASAANSTMSTTDSAYSSTVSGLSTASNAFSYMNNNMTQSAQKSSHSLHSSSGGTTKSVSPRANTSYMSANPFKASSSVVKSVAPVQNVSQEIKVETNVAASNSYQSPILRQQADMRQQQESNNVSPQQAQVSPPVKSISARALYDYDADDDTEISFLPGDVITEIDQFDPGWWTGKGPDGKIGMFPANYVEVIP